MKIENQKFIWVLVGVIIVLVVISLAIFWITGQRRSTNNPILGEAKKADNLESFVKNNTQLMTKEKAEPLSLENLDVTPPVPTKVNIKKITLVPKLIVGGDALYEPVVELPGNNFLILSPAQYKEVFSVNTADEALEYIEFLEIKMGKSTYDRIRQTVKQVGDYDKIGCRVMQEEENKPLPMDRAVSQVKEQNDGFAVEWVYFTQAYPAGYYKISYFVGRNGDVVAKDKPDQPFWSCGQGILF